MDSFIGWIGGKKLLRKAVYERFPNKIHKYVEPFGGAGWVLFYKEKHAETEVYSRDRKIAAACFLRRFCPLFGQKS